jgi:hypothetical protein
VYHCRYALQASSSCKHGSTTTCFAGQTAVGRLSHLTVAIPEHFESGPTRPTGPARAQPAPGTPTNLTGRAWAEILKPAEIFLARAWPEMLFLVVLHYKMRGRPAQARAGPEN